MTKEERFEIKLSNDMKQYLKKQDNASELIRTLLDQHMSGGDTLYKRKSIAEQRVEEAKAHVIDLELELEHINHQIQEFEENKLIRPDGYQDCVERLLRLPLIHTSDIEYQAELLNVDKMLFKRWLFDDGFYDKKLR